MKSISFLLGAGFSIYANISDRKEINNRLKNLTSDDFIISSVSIAYFTSDLIPKQTWENFYERKFTEFTIKRYVDKHEEFDYEEFYDYAKELYNNHSTSNELENLYKDFLKEHPDHKLDKLNSISIVIRTIDQLIDNALYFDGDLFKTEIINKYSNFLTIIEKYALEDYQINIFTLNHDLLLENLMSTSLKIKFCDGFDYFRTPYYIKQNGFQFRIKFYNKKFDCLVKIYKLHGSIDNYKVNYSSPYDMIKIPKKLNLLELYREKETDGKFEEEHLWTLYKPNFLSGDNTKISKYSSHPYYIDLFKEFSSKLKQSDTLILIGYGLMDEEINSKILKSFPVDKKILVVKRTKGNKDFYIRNNIIHFGIGKELKDLDIKTIEDLLK